MLKGDVCWIVWYTRRVVVTVVFVFVDSFEF